MFPASLRAHARCDRAATPGSARWGPRLFLAESRARSSDGAASRARRTRTAPSRSAIRVAPGWEGRGVATAAVAELLCEAWAAPDVRCVLAHTLPPQRLARVLEKSGFVRAGENLDGDVGGGGDFASLGSVVAGYEPDRAVVSDVRQPFEQGRFEDLPERPRVPHRFYDGETSTVLVHSAPLGLIATHVVSYGPRDAPPLLLIHGLMTTSYSWRYLFEPLGERFRLVVPDLPGTGRSAIPAADRPLSATALATFIGELQDTLGIRGCATVGNSLGGSLCLRSALQDPARFARLAVIHPPTFEPRLVALHLALATPGVGAVLGLVVRHDPLRWAHSQVHYYDETLKSLEEAHEYGDPLAGAAGARAFVRYLRDPLAPRPLAHARARAAAPARQRRRLSPAAHARLRARGPDGAAEGRAPAAEARARQRVSLDGGDLALPPGRPSATPRRAAPRLPLQPLSERASYRRETSDESPGIRARTPRRSASPSSGGESLRDPARTRVGRGSARLTRTGAAPSR